MKKIYALLLTALTFSTYAGAQDDNLINITGPTFIEEFSKNDIHATGISSDGRYIFGLSPNGSAAIYDFEGQKTFTMLNPDPQSTTPVTIAGATPDGRIVISTYYSSYILNLEDGSKVMIESPDENYGVDVWDVSADGKYIACNLTYDGFTTFPTLGIMQEDGTYKVEELDYNSEDAMGCEAQYTQARYISDDGKYIMGIQPDYRGMGGRPVVWTRQDDGTYLFSSPMDEYIYDFTYDKPGKTPEWYEYVTADQVKDPELFEKQNEMYIEAFNQYVENYMNFTRNGSSFETLMMLKGTRNNTLCSGYYDYRTDIEYGGMIPVFYDCENNTITEYTDMPLSSYGVPMSMGLDELPGGGHIVSTYNYGFYILTAIEKDGNKKPFEEWLKDISGTDISEHYTFSYYNPNKGSNETGVFLGKPIFCDNGKMMVLSGMNSKSKYITSVIRFDRDIFEATQTGIDENFIDDININGSIINLGSRHAVADVYDINGAEYGSFSINGTFDFNRVLSHGTYIIKLNIDGSKTVSKKLIVK